MTFCRIVLVALFVHSAIFASIAWAHSGATGIVKERMQLMKDIASDTKALGLAFRGKTPYDPAEIAAAAERIAEHAGTRLTALFPDGSNDHPSEASSEIWSDWERFTEIADDLRISAQRLADEASSGQTATAPLFGDVARTCKACHQDFRIDD